MNLGLTCLCPDAALKGVCPVHVGCENACGALREPTTEAEFRATLEHWEVHCFQGGMCAHGY